MKGALISSSREWMELYLPRQACGRIKEAHDRLHPAGGEESRVAME